MQKPTKFMIKFASVLLVLGIVIFVVGMIKTGWDFKKLSTVKYVTNTYEIQEDFSNISIKTTTADILFVPSDTNKCEVVCHETITELHSVSVENDTLTIDAVNTKKWYDYIGIIILDTPKITVYLPKEYYALVKVNLTTGDVSLSNLVLDELKVTTTTGDTSLSDISCKALSSTGSTGKITLNNVVAEELLSVKRSTGNITLNACDGGEIILNTTTGNIKGTLLSEKIFKAKSTTGSVSVPDTHTGGNCNISVTTGNIKIKIAE